MNKITRYGALIEEALAKQEYGINPIELYEPIRYILKLGGKRLRPALTIAACKMMGGSEEEALMPSLGIEVFHNFSLIHDDIMDNAPVRRGSPSVHEKWNTNIAILSGDAMLVKAYQYVARVQPKVLPEVLQVFSKTAIEVCEGQQYDMNFELREDVSEEEYLEMIRLKTSVLLGCAMKVGALIAGASRNESEALYDFGVNIGIAFQIQDDILDTFGDKSKVGKKEGGDIISDKKTLMMIHAMKNSNDISQWLGKKENEAEKVKTIRAIFDQTGSRKYATDKMEHYYSEAIVKLDSVNGDKEIGDELRSFARYLISREF